MGWGFKQTLLERTADKPHNAGGRNCSNAPRVGQDGRLQGSIGTGDDAISESANWSLWLRGYSSEIAAIVGRRRVQH